MWGLTGGTCLAFEDLFDDDDRFGDGGAVEIDGVVVCGCGTASRQGWHGDGIDTREPHCRHKGPPGVTRTVSIRP